MEARERYFKAIEGRSDLTREEYEDVCKTENIEVFSEDEILANYGIKFGDFDFDEDFDLCLKMFFAKSRLKKIEKETENFNKKVFENQFSKKLSCGCTVYSENHIMHTTSGSACPDCYDEMSN